MKFANVFRHPAAVLVLFFCMLSISGAAKMDTISVHAVRTEKPPRIDGILDDAVWQTAIPIDRFTQKDPDEFAKPTQGSEVRVLYDDKHLYVGARLYDSAPDSIVGCLVRRDYGIDSDGFWVDLDPYLSRRSGYYFALDPTGSLYDGVLYNDSWEDNSWDGVWHGKTSIDSLGWCAEFMIPFSQLRFQKSDSMVWGVNFWRWVTRRHETTYLSFAPRNESGFVSRFPKLYGLKDVPTPRYVELLPYVRGKARFRQTLHQDPFNNDAEFNGTAGLDAKIGLSPNLVLDATVNPDFGQVEVDPAVVNLTDVETYFDEKRPFFMEGSRNFDFGTGGSTTYNSFNWSDPTFFYSRRIGRTPQGRLPYYDFAEVPDGTRILGAGKVTGTLGGNWNVGSIHGVTAREFADVKLNDDRAEFEIEPATYYTVNRALKEFGGGFRGLGGILTATHRMFDDETLEDQLNSNAFVGGVDGWTFLDRQQTYVLSGWLGGSHVRGNEARMIRLQRSSAHYFQRPDASYVNVDSSATSLTGFAGRMVLNKERGNWVLHSAFGAIDPNFETNDLGYMSRGDVINGHIDGGYRWTRPTSWTRYASLRTAVAGNTDFGGNVTNFMFRISGRADFQNYYGAEAKLYGYPLETISNTRTRGGPRTKSAAQWSGTLYAYSDTRKPVELSSYTSYARVAGDDWTLNQDLTLRLKPAPNLNLSVGPSLSLSKDFVQWVGAFPDPEARETYGTRYVFSAMDYTELSASIRVNWTFTPRLSLQAFIQPLFSTGDYRDFKQLMKPNSYDFDIFPSQDVQYSDGVYVIDPDGGGPASEFGFYNPDFSMNSLRGNFVLKWEYSPGSTLFFVWTHGRLDYETNGEFDLNRATDRLVEADPDDIFMIKGTYWFSL